MNQQQVQRLVVGAGGIYISYLLLSILSQKLFSSEYPSIKEQNVSHKFEFPSLLIWFSSLLSSIYGYITSHLKKQRPNPIPLKQKIILGFLNTTNMICANFALLYITFIEQNIARNCRYLMVVVVGAFASRVKSSSKLKIQPKKVVIGSIITLGVLMFTILGSSNKHSKHLDPGNHWIGYILVAISIIADALFSDSQAYSKANFQPSSNHLFISASWFTFIFVFVFSLISGQLFDQIHFCLTHPSVMKDVLIMSILQVFGQISIYYVISNFKQHIFPLISTTRKIFTVLLSIFIFGHQLSLLQYLSILVVFGGLIYQLNEELSSHKHKNQGGNHNQSHKGLQKDQKSKEEKEHLHKGEKKNNAGSRQSVEGKQIDEKQREKKKKGK